MANDGEDRMALPIGSLRTIGRSIAVTTQFIMLPDTSGLEFWNFSKKSDVIGLETVNLEIAANSTLMLVSSATVNVIKSSNLCSSTQEIQNGLESLPP